MQGGFFDGIPPVLPPAGYYQLGQTAQGDQYANTYLNRWANYRASKELLGETFQHSDSGTVSTHV